MEKYCSLRKKKKNTEYTYVYKYALLLRAVAMKLNVRWKINSITRKNMTYFKLT